MENAIKAGQKINLMVADGCTITINRPDGTVDVLKNPGGFREMNAIIFKKIVAATKAAGRGDVVAWENLKKPATYTVSEADAATDSTEKIERTMAYGEVR